jgi:hypothetical protein
LAESRGRTHPGHLLQRRKRSFGCATEEAKAERDKLAKELADIYPVFAERVAELLPCIATNDREIEYINAQALPSGARHLLVAELLAGGPRGFVENSIDIPRITQQLRLPAFRYCSVSPYVWPR